MLTIRKFIFIWAFFFLPTILVGQKSTFLNKDLKKIDSIQYMKKCGTFNRKCYAIKMDDYDTLVNVTYQRYHFGKLNNLQLQRIIKELDAKDVTKTYIVHYIDALLDYNGYVNRQKKCYQKRINDSINFKNENPDYPKYFYCKSVLPKSQKDILKEDIKLRQILKKYQKKYRKYNTEIVHYYYSGNTGLFPSINWIKDNNKVFKNLLFKYYNQYSYAIIKPDGEYFLFESSINPKQLNKLIKNQNWKKYKDDLKRSELKNKPVGFFNVEHAHTPI